MVKLNLPPGPSSSSFLGTYLAFRKYNLLDYATEARRVYGDIVHVKLGLQHVVIFSNPHDVNHILTNPEHKYEKAKSTAVEMITSDSLNTLPTNAEWSDKANTFKTCLDKITIEQHETALNTQLIETFSHWDSDPLEMQNISLDMLALTMSVMQRLMLKIDPHNYDTKEINLHKYEIVVQALTRGVGLVNKPVIFDRTLSHAIDFKHTLVSKIVSEYLKNPNADKNSYLGKIVEKYKIKKMTMKIAKKITGEVMNALYLGSDPSDKLLSWTFYFLSMYPNEAKKVIEEIKSVSSLHDITMNNLSKFSQTTMFINEVLRLRTPYALIARVALEEDVLRGYTIPKNTLCIVSPLLVHKHPEFWDNPEAFNPQRFENLSPAALFAFIPFSGGSRPCLGRSFAYRQSLYIITKILQRYDFQLAPYFDYDIRFLGVLGSQSDIKGHLAKRA